jgi:hypothetical protein
MNSAPVKGSTVTLTVNIWPVSGPVERNVHGGGGMARICNE